MKSLKSSGNLTFTAHLSQRGHVSSPQRPQELVAMAWTMQVYGVYTNTLLPPNLNQGNENLKKYMINRFSLKVLGSKQDVKSR